MRSPQGYPSRLDPREQPPPLEPNVEDLVFAPVSQAEATLKPLQTEGMDIKGVK